MYHRVPTILILKFRFTIEILLYNKIFTRYQNLESILAQGYAMQLEALWAVYNQLEKTTGAKAWSYEMWSVIFTTIVHRMIQSGCYHISLLEFSIQYLRYKYIFELYGLENWVRKKHLQLKACSLWLNIDN